MKEDAILKINKMGKVGCVLVNIMKAFLGIGLFFVIVGLVLSFIIPKEAINVTWGGDAQITLNITELNKIIKPGFTAEEAEAQINKLSENGSLSVDKEEYAVANMQVVDDNIVLGVKANSPKAITISGVRKMLAMLTVYLIFVGVTLYFAQALCKAFRDCSSPFEENVITKINHLAYALIPWVFVDGLSSAAMSILSGNGANLSININEGVILTVLVVFALAFVFKYGAVLQKESDETL